MAATAVVKARNLPKELFFFAIIVSLLNKCKVYSYAYFNTQE
jgi:hypothetical protein